MNSSVSWPLQRRFRELRARRRGRRLGDEGPLVEEAEADLVVAAEDLGRVRSREPVRRAEVDVPVVVAVAAPDDVAVRHGSRSSSRPAPGTAARPARPAAAVAAHRVDDERTDADVRDRCRELDVVSLPSISTAGTSTGVTWRGRGAAGRPASERAREASASARRSTRAPPRARAAERPRARAETAARHARGYPRPRRTFLPLRGVRTTRTRECHSPFIGIRSDPECRSWPLRHQRSVRLSDTHGGGVGP